MMSLKDTVTSLETEYFQLLEAEYKASRTVEADPSTAGLLKISRSIVTLRKLVELKELIYNLKSKLVNSGLEGTGWERTENPSWLKRQVDKLDDVDDRPDWLRNSSGANATLNSPHRKVSKEILDFADKLVTGVVVEQDSAVNQKEYAELEILRSVSRSKEEVASWKPWMRAAMGIPDEGVSREANPQDSTDEKLKLVYNILWDMNWFGDFGNRKEFLNQQLEKLKGLVDK